MQASTQRMLVQRHTVLCKSNWNQEWFQQQATNACNKMRSLAINFVYCDHLKNIDYSCSKTSYQKHHIIVCWNVTTRYYLVRVISFINATIRYNHVLVIRYLLVLTIWYVLILTLWCSIHSITYVSSICLIYYTVVLIH